MSTLHSSAMEFVRFVLRNTMKIMSIGFCLVSMFFIMNVFLLDLLKMEKKNARMIILRLGKINR